MIALFCATLAACRPALEAGGSSDALALQLIGREYAVVPYSDAVSDEIACKRASSGGVWQAGAEKAGWTYGVLLCDGDVPYLFLAKSNGVTQFAKADGDPPQPYPRNKILAVQKLPKVSSFTSDGEDVDLPGLVDSFAGQCDLGDDEERSFVALVRWSGEAIVKGSPGVQAVWGFDVESAQIVPLNPQKVTCEPMLMD